MVKLALIHVFVFLICIMSASGQKVKYKDIWALLNTKQYESAEPFLKNYLKENDDNPNAYLYMGMIYQEKSYKDDVLKQTKRSIAHMDSAIMFYDKAYKAITEKEIKRNDEYYQSYNRRDLRTGEFGVKLSDIQFDLEKRMEALKERADRLKMVKHYFKLTDSLYKKSNILFQSIQRQYNSEKEFYLRANDTTLQKLMQLSARFDSCIRAFDNYKSASSALGKTGYSQTLTKNEIRKFKIDGASLADFFSNDVQVWNYKLFADNSKQIIEKDIMPMREHLISYDMEINKLREKLTKDSVSVNNDLTKLVDKLLMEQLKKFDPDPLPMKIFSLKISDLEYRSALLEHTSKVDSANVHWRLKLAQKEVRLVSRLDSIAMRLLAGDLDNEAVDYSFFVKNTYSNATVLKSFVRAQKEFAEREKEERLKILEKRKEALLWIVNAPDSVPLFKGDTALNFKPLVIAEEKYTGGLHYVDSLQVSGYFYSITPSRKPDVNVIFPVDKVSFKESRLRYANSLIYSDASGQMYFVLLYANLITKDNKYPVTLAKIYRSDGLAWSINYMLTYVPKEISYKAETSEITIKGDSQQTVLDKNGKVISK